MSARDLEASPPPSTSSTCTRWPLPHEWLAKGCHEFCFALALCVIVVAKMALVVH